VHEAEKLGFKVCCMPASNMKYIKRDPGIKVVGISSVKDLYDFIGNQERSFT
jgi:predicted ATP-dependent serine protease